jgi:hypothetical protein
MFFKLSPCGVNAAFHKRMRSCFVIFQCSHALFYRSKILLDLTDISRNLVSARVMSEICRWSDKLDTRSSPTAADMSYPFVALRAAS